MSGGLVLSLEMNLKGGIIIYESMEYYIREISIVYLRRISKISSDKNDILYIRVLNIHGPERKIYPLCNIGLSNYILGNSKRY